MKRKILIADDHDNNRSLLREILENDYEILEARDGKTALLILKKSYNTISAVLLDSIMPKLDGFTVLEKMRENPMLSTIPVIILSRNSDEKEEEKALLLGAIDFVAKPYRPAIIKQRLYNAITLRENASILNTMQKDELTGLYNRKTFLTKAASMVKLQSPGYYVMSCFDIDKFKVINDQFGTTKGDEVLKNLAQNIKETMDDLGGICARFDSDDFALLYPQKFMDSEKILNLHKKAEVFDSDFASFTVSIGRYIVDDLTIPVNGMYDRALLALFSIKGNYDKKMAYYDESMRTEMIKEQEVVSEMQTALVEKQFEVWFQPQYNHATKKLIGAEALVRWRHPVKGLIPPFVFIPIFERNGFVYELDKYVWEQSCLLLRKWMDEGHKPLPISVNVSRYDALREDFFETITGIVNKHDIPAELFRMEITESAFAEATEHIISVVKRLIQYGFTIEIDDFGSGYSSLNTLKDVPAQILKLDMRFFAKTDNVNRSGNIIESVVRMAKWLGMVIIAEGVEDKEQADYLKSIGCCYIQGYFYAKPLPIAEYEVLFADSEKEPELIGLETLDTLDNNEFWNPKSMETLIFNSYVGGACIFEYHDGETELLRVNDRYIQELGRLALNEQYLNELSPVRYLDDNNKDIMFQNIKNAIRLHKESTCELTLCDNSESNPLTEYVRVTVRAIARTGKRYLFYCVVVNITEQYVAEQERLEAERKHLEMANRLSIIMKNINGGVSAIQIEDNATSKLIFHNEKYYELYGYTSSQAYEEKLDIMTLIVPEDLPEVMNKVTKLKSDGIPTIIDYRIIRRDGRMVNLRANSSLMEIDGYNNVITSVVTDVTENYLAQKEAKELTDKLNTVLNHAGNGITALVLHKDAPEVLFANERYFEIIGYTREEYKEITKNDMFAMVHPEDQKWLHKAVQEFHENPGTVTTEYRVIRKDGKTVWIQNVVTITKLHGIDAPVQIGIFSDVTQKKKMTNQLRLLTDSVPAGIATFTYSTEGIILESYNNRLCRMLGYSDNIENLSLGDFMSFVDIDDKEMIDSKIQSMINEKTPIDTIFRIYTKEKQCKWISLKAIVTERKGDSSFVYSIFLDVTEQRKEDELLRVNEELNRLAIEYSGNIITRFDVKARTLTLPHSLPSIFKLPHVLNHMPDKQIALRRVSPDTADMYIELFEDIIKGSKTGTAVFKQNSTKGWRWLEARYTTVFSDSGEAVSAVISFTDITEKLEREGVYNKWKQSLDERERKSFTLFRCNLNKCTAFHSCEGDLLQIRVEDEDISFDEFINQYAEKNVYEKDIEKYTTFLKSDRLLANYHHRRRSGSLEFRGKCKDGELRWINLTLDLVEYPNSKDIEVYLMFEDIDKQKKEELLTLERSEKDPLTGILNRAAFIENMDRVLKKSIHEEQHAMFMMDIDNFKQINDTLGHDAGDKVLIELTKQIGSILRTDDLIGRMGGDEFFVFLRDIPNRTVAVNKVERIQELVIKTDGMEKGITLSIGIAMIPENGACFNDLYKKVDMALYQRKNNGKNGYLFVEE